MDAYDRHDPRFDHRESRRTGLALAITLAIVLALIVALIVWLLAEAGDDAALDPVVADLTDVTIAELTSDPAPYIGSQVTLEGEVAEVYSPSAFLLEEDELLEGDDVLVYATDLAPIEGAEVTVTGTVEQVDEEFITDNAAMFLDDFSFDTIAGKAAIAADTVVVQ